MRIRFDRVTKRFGDQAVVRDLNLDVAEGEMLVLLGPSGCGKTTSLRMVAGLESVSEGSIYIGSRRVNDVPPRHRDLAMVFQNYALYPHMTVFENIEFPLRVRKIEPTDRARKVREIAERLEIGDFLQRLPRQLSGGQRQRVALARAIVREPVAFLMDEPLSNLDARLRLQTRAELKHLQGELGTTTLYVTHDQAEAMTLAHRIAILKDGVLQQAASPLEIYLKPVNAFVAGFVGSPPMNFLPGFLSGEGFVLEDTVLPLPDHLRDACESSLRARGGSARPLLLGFRPEAARLDGRDLEGRVFVVEEMGSETLVVVEIKGHRVTLKTVPGVRRAAGERINFSIPQDSLYLFDQESGERIAARRDE